MDEEIADDPAREEVPDKRHAPQVELVIYRDARARGDRLEAPGDFHAFCPACDVREFDARHAGKQTLCSGPSHGYAAAPRRHDGDALCRLLAQNVNESVVRQELRPTGDVLDEIVDRARLGGDLDGRRGAHHARSLTRAAGDIVCALGTAPATAASTISAAAMSRRARRSASARKGGVRTMKSTTAASMRRGRSMRRRAAAIALTVSRVGAPARCAMTPAAHVTELSSATATPCPTNGSSMPAASPVSVTPGAATECGA